MPRIPIDYRAPDISALARSLRDQLIKLGETPSHVQLLNMLARAVGHRNFQHFRAGAKPEAVPGSPETSPLSPADERRIARAAGFFDAQQRLVSWPAKTNLQQLGLWTMWARLPPRQVFTEIEI